jgi:uncharacterized protein
MPTAPNARSVRRRETDQRLAENRPVAIGSLLLLLDDIASVLDDVALLTKAAAAKTAGVVGDDIAVSANRMGGVASEREWPVVWAVARGSLVNKAILVPAALALSAVAPALVMPVLMAGGVYLCIEGAEKVFHGAPGEGEQPRPFATAPAEPGPDGAAGANGLVALERDRIRGAIRTDLVLSAEIIVIALGNVAGAPFATRALVLCGVGVLMTAGVYGFVAAIVKVDDFGLWLALRDGRSARRVGLALLQAAPWLMRLLAWVGTAAMIFVGGGILAHGIPGWHDALANALAPIGGLGRTMLLAVADALVGIAAGAVALAAVAVFRRLRVGRGG